MSDAKSSAHIIKHRRSVNGDLTATQSAYNTAMIGSPRGDFAQAAQDATDHDFIAMIWKGHFAGQPTWGLKPFCAVLQDIDSDLRQNHSRIYQRLGHCGVLSCRLTRISQYVISNHSWGIAIDLTLGGQREIDLTGQDFDDLATIAPVFMNRGLYWGLSFPRPEATHFEASRQLIQAWASEGLIRGAENNIFDSIQFGERSVEIENMQRAINELLETSYIQEDGIYGIDTRNAVIEAHIRLGMSPEAQASPQFMRNLIGE